MPEPLVCEDTSLVRLMETVNRTPGARILYQDTVRRGGVLGFFTREVHRVAYLAGDQPDQAGQPDQGAEAAEQGNADPIASLLAAAEAAEARLRTSDGDNQSQPDGDGPAQPDFASVLRRYVAAADATEALIAGTNATETKAAGTKAAGTATTEATAPEATATELFEAAANRNVTATKPIAEVTPLGPRGRDARNRLELLMQLRQIGVPASLNPAGNPQSPYEALEDILDQLPPPAELPSGAGQLIVLVGDGVAAVRAARTVSRLLRLRLSAIVAAGVESGLSSSVRRISSPAEAALLREELAGAATPTVLVVATDGAGLEPDDPWPAAMIAALRPDAVWSVLDARWKVEDCRAQLARLPRTDALVVHAAELSGSPATVWEMDLPIGLLDDRRPTNFIWLGMLIRLVGGSPRHRASERAGA